MINYSTYMWKSPLDETAKEQAYAKNQVTKVMSFDDFVKHISDHNGVFTRGTVKGVVSDTCSCLVEQLLNGYKVQFGELGIFSISITCEPAATLKDFSSDNIKAVNILFNPGIDFENLRSKAEFNLVTSRAIQAASLKAVKENKDSLFLMQYQMESLQLAKNLIKSAEENIYDIVGKKVLDSIPVEKDASRMELEEVQKYCEDNEWRKKLKISSKMLAKHIKRYYSSIKECDL